MKASILSIVGHGGILVLGTLVLSTSGHGQDTARLVRVAAPSTCRPRLMIDFLVKRGIPLKGGAKAIAYRG